MKLKKVFVRDSITGDTIQKTLNVYYHKVQTGEVINKVAAYYSVNSDQIMDWNGLKTTNIYTGQHLRIETEKNGGGRKQQINSSQSREENADTTTTLPTRSAPPPHTHTLLIHS